MWLGEGGVGQGLSKAAGDGTRIHDGGGGARAEAGAQWRMREEIWGGGSRSCGVWSSRGLRHMNPRGFTVAVNGSGFFFF
jgi:hypothetical protein